jgi:hypothetical protein
MAFMTIEPAKAPQPAHTETRYQAALAVIGEASEASVKC